MKNIISKNVFELVEQNLAIQDFWRKVDEARNAKGPAKKCRINHQLQFYGCDTCIHLCDDGIHCQGFIEAGPEDIRRVIQCPISGKRLKDGSTGRGPLSANECDDTSRCKWTKSSRAELTRAKRRGYLRLCNDDKTLRKAHWNWAEKNRLPVIVVGCKDDGADVSINIVHTDVRLSDNARERLYSLFVEFSGPNSKTLHHPYFGVVDKVEPERACMLAERLLEFYRTLTA